MPDKWQSTGGKEGTEPVRDATGQTVALRRCPERDLFTPAYFLQKRGIEDRIQLHDRFHPVEGGPDLFGGNRISMLDPFDQAIVYQTLELPCVQVAGIERPNVFLALLDCVEAIHPGPRD